MNSRKLTIISALILPIALLILVGCMNSHVRHNRDAVHGIRVQREIPDAIKVTIKTNSSSDTPYLFDSSGLLDFPIKSEDGEHYLALNLEDYNEKTRVVTSSASGVVLTHDGLILTNHHVTRTNSKQIEVVLKRGKNEIKRTATLEAFSTFGPGGNDLAVIKVNAHFNNVVRLGEPRQIYESAIVYNWGFPFGLSPRSQGRAYFLGEISIKRSVIPFFSNQPRFLMGIEGVGGVSGSGIFAGDGRLIGIMQGYAGSRLWMVGIPVDQIRHFLDQHRIPYSG